MKLKKNCASCVGMISIYNLNRVNLLYHSNCDVLANGSTVEWDDYSINHTIIGFANKVFNNITPYDEPIEEPNGQLRSIKLKSELLELNWISILPNPTNDLCHLVFKLPEDFEWIRAINTKVIYRNKIKTKYHEKIEF